MCYTGRPALRESRLKNLQSHPSSPSGASASFEQRSRRQESASFQLSATVQSAIRPSEDKKLEHTHFFTYSLGVRHQGRCSISCRTTRNWLRDGQRGQGGVLRPSIGAAEWNGEYQTVSLLRQAGVTEGSPQSGLADRQPGTSVLRASAKATPSLPYLTNTRTRISGSPDRKAGDSRPRVTG